MEEACGFGLAKRTSTLGSPTSNVKHNVGVPAGAIKCWHIVPRAGQRLTCLNLAYHQSMRGHRFDFDFTLDFISVDAVSYTHLTLPTIITV